MAHGSTGCQRKPCPAAAQRLTSGPKFRQLPFESDFARGRKAQSPHHGIRGIHPAHPVLSSVLLSLRNELDSSRSRLWIDFLRAEVVTPSSTLLDSGVTGASAF